MPCCQSLLPLAYRAASLLLMSALSAHIDLVWLSSSTSRRHCSTLILQQNEWFAGGCYARKTGSSKGSSSAAGQGSRGGEAKKAADKLTQEEDQIWTASHEAQNRQVAGDIATVNLSFTLCSILILNSSTTCRILLDFESSLLQHLLNGFVAIQCEAACDLYLTQHTLHVPASWVNLAHHLCIRACVWLTCNGSSASRHQGYASVNMFISLLMPCVMDHI